MRKRKKKKKKKKKEIDVTLSFTHTEYDTIYAKLLHTYVQECFDMSNISSDILCTITENITRLGEYAHTSLRGKLV